MKKIIFLTILLLLFCLSLVVSGCLDPNKKDYEAANNLFDTGDFKAAGESFYELNEYKDSEERAKQSLYFYAGECFDKQDFDEAIKIYQSLDGYLDSSEKEIEVKNEKIYIAAVEVAYKNNKDYFRAINILELIRDYKDSANYIAEISGILYAEALDYMDGEQYEEAAEVFKWIINHADSEEMLDKCNNYINYNQAVYFFDDGQLDSAYSKFSELGDFLDSSSYAAYIEAGKYAEEKKYGEAAEKYLFQSLQNFLDSAELYEKCAYIYCDEQYQLGNTDISVPERYINKWRNKRVNDLKNNLSAISVNVTGIGLYVDDTLDKKYGIEILVRKVIQDVPVFFLADSPQKIRYIMSFGASEKYYGTYSDGTDGYETTVTITIKDTVTNQILFSESYAAPPPFRTAQKGDIYGNYDFFEIGENGESAYSRDILPVLESLFNKK